MPDKPIPFSSYLDPKHSLRDWVDILSDPDTLRGPNAEETDTAIMNLVVRYTLEYMNMGHLEGEEAHESVRNRLREIQDAKREKIMRAFQQGGMAGAFEGILSYANDHAGLECLIDTRATAALVKEIAFEDRFVLHSNHTFIGVDLGSGTGILSLAMAIAGMRKQASQILIFGFDRSDSEVQKAHKILQKTGMTIPQNTANICQPKMYAEIFQPPTIPNFFTSETISIATPKATRVRENGIEWNRPRTPFEMFQNEVVASMDPFPEVMNLLLRHVPRFFEQVQNGRIALFPNIISGDYKSPQLKLRTGKKPSYHLSEVGSDFSRYQDFGKKSRWQAEDEQGHP